MTKLNRSLILSCSMLALASCGGDEIVSPGTGGDIIINNPGTPAPSPSPSPTPTQTVSAADDCPNIAGLTDDGIISGPTGSYRKCILPNQIDQSIALPYIEGVLYALDGRVDVGSDGGRFADASDGLSDTNVTLTIDPGVVVYAETGRSFLYVNRGNTIQAVGTASRPIVFTSRQNVVGTATASSEGQWGGVIISGRAPVTDCNAGNTGAAVDGTGECERQIEGESDPALYGGNVESDDSGRMSYVQIRYSGVVLSEGSELQSLTTGGTGYNTQFDHIMSYNSSDDGMEFFGGFVNMKYAVVVGAGDDAIDSDVGAATNIQYAILVQRPGVGNSFNEIDSNSNRDATPRQDFRLSNATMVASSAFGDDTAIYARGGTDYWLANSVLVSPQETCLRVRHAETVQETGIDERGPVRFDSVVMQCGSPIYLGEDGVSENQIQTLFSANGNNDDMFTPSLMSVFINGANENGVDAYDTSNLDTMFFDFDAVDYIGAVRDASDDWYTGWTCNSSTVTFGDNIGDCASLPVY